MRVAQSGVGIFLVFSWYFLPKAMLKFKEIEKVLLEEKSSSKKCKQMILQLIELNRQIQTENQVLKTSNLDLITQIDTKNLILSNKRYEAQSLQKEIARINTLDKIHLDIDLIPLEELEEEIEPGQQIATDIDQESLQTEIQNTPNYADAMAVDEIISEHDIMLKRLTLELKERKNLVKRLSAQKVAESMIDKQCDLKMIEIKRIEVEMDAILKSVYVLQESL
jgi:hypothetical protein